MDIRTERLNIAFNNSPLTQTELCKKTGITKGALSSYLCGRYFPKQVALEKLSNALHVSIQYLMGMDEAAVEVSSKYSQLIAMIESLNEEGIEKVYAYVSDLNGNPVYKKCGEAGLVQKEA